MEEVEEEGYNLRQEVRPQNRSAASQGDLEGKQFRQREQQVDDKSTCPQDYCEAGVGVGGDASEEPRTGPGPQSGLTDDTPTAVLTLALVTFPCWFIYPPCCL